MKRKNSLINLTKANIYHLYPQIIYLKISMNKLKNNYYRGKIALKTKTTSFFVSKETKNYKDSLDSARNAIKKQLERVKLNRVHQSKPEAVFGDETDGSIT